MKSNFIETPRGNFHYRAYGNPENPALVLIHGWPESSYCWNEVAEILKSDYFIIAPDLRGLGDSNRELAEDAYEKNELARDIIGILNQLNIDAFFLAGHDWGGAVVQEMAFLIPQRIKRLVILNIMIIHNVIGKMKGYESLGKSLFAPFWYQFFQRNRELPEALLQDKEEAWIRFFIKGVSKPIPESSVLEYIRCYKIPGTITTGANYYRTMGRDMRRWEGESFTGRQLEMPTLILQGALDRVIIKEYFEGIEQCFNEVKLTWVDSGHFILDEKPEAVAVELKDFFTD